MRKANIKKWGKLAVMLAVFATLLLLPKPSQLQVAYGQGYGYDDEPAPPTTGGGVGGVTTSGGVFTKETTFKSDDENLTLTIPKGTVGQTKAGDPLPEVRITGVHPQAPPQDMSFIGLNYDLEPDGATFDPPVMVTFTYNPGWIPSGLGPESLTLGYYDQDTQQWVMLDAGDITIDPNTNTITASISHFTVFSVMALTAPAEFTISNLTISPAEFEVAEKSTISVAVANIGDVSGTTRVTLKLNGVAVSSKLVKLAGHESQTVSFTTVQGEPGSYKVDIDGLSGTFTVKPATVKPVVITSAVPSVTAPAVEYPAPTAPTPPAVPAPVPAPTPWLAIIISLVASVIVAVIIVWYYGFRSEY
ncbi:MAG: hypothetical protein GH158_01470 [Dehalococcoidia bacterium]|nr:hypothetical protein [Dehalococcoidia bacterium]